MKKVVFNFGRYQCPHIGHDSLIKQVHTVASLEKAEPRIYISKTTNNKKGKNPLPMECKLHWLKIMLPQYSDSFITEHGNDPFRVMTEMYEEGVTDVICIVGEDWVQNLTMKFEKYNGNIFNFNSIDIRSSGSRSGSTIIEQASGTKMRELVKEGNLLEFTNYVPYGINVVEYFNDIKQYIG